MGSNDLDRLDNVAGTVFLVEASANGTEERGDILMVPIPSDDLNDPLRWSRWRKNYHLCLLVLYSTIVAAITNSASVVFDQLLEAYNTSSTSLNIGFAINLLMLGISNVFLIPLSNKFGRRPVYLLSLVFCVGAQVWQAKSKSIGDFWGVTILLGIGAAPLEALVALSIADIFFTHERGAKISYYVFGLNLGSFLGPVAAGYIDVGQGWPWVFYWGAILSAVCLVLFYGTLEESYFYRKQCRVLQQPRLVQVDSAMQGESSSKDNLTHEIRLQQNVTEHYKVGQLLRSNRYRLQYKLWICTPVTWTAVLNDFWWPLQLSIFPAVLWCGLFYGTVVSWLSVLGSTVANVFSPPPYLFSNDALGLFWIAPMVGSIFGIIYSGPLNDRFMLAKTRRNRGYREPEFLLWCAVPTAFIMSAGLMLYGIASARGLPWIVPFVGAGLVGFGLAVGGEISIAYTIDCYTLLDTQAVTTVILIRNIIGFAITWAIQPWIESMGQQNAFILVGALSFFISIFAVVMIIFGKRWREWTQPRYEKLVLERA